MIAISLLCFGLASFSMPGVSADQSYLGIFAETQVMHIQGVKPRPMPKLPPGFKLPPAAAAMMSGAPKRSLVVRVWSPSIAPDSATATLAPPPALKLGDKLNLELFRPQAGSTGAGSGDQGSGTSEKAPDLTIKIYWGSSATVRDGQPKVFKLADLTAPGQMEVMKHVRIPSFGGGGQQGGSGSYYYKDGWTTAYWPSNTDSGEIPDGASLSGTFNLQTNYAGNVSIDAPSGVDFLPGIEMSSPDLGSKINFDSAIDFKWSSLPNAIGQYATVFGMEGKNTMIIWSSSADYADQITGDMGYMQMADVKDCVGRKVFMPGDATGVTLPAGIYKDADFVMMNMVAYGPGSAKDGVQPAPRIQTKSTLNWILGGKKMRGGGGSGEERRNR